MAQIKCVFNIHSFISIEFAENHIFRVDVAIRIANKNNIFDANVFDTKISRRIKICIKSPPLFHLIDLIPSIHSLKFFNCSLPRSNAR